LHVDELWGVRTSLDFVFLQPTVVQTELKRAGFEIVESTTRLPYAPGVEAQTTRCYVLARRPFEAKPAAVAPRQWKS
jgi:hypothetical protein